MTEFPPQDTFDAARTAGVRRAVIDIGSNSVRMVVYDGPRRAPFAICNEKALCGLGRNMGPDGTLNPDAVKLALSTLKRFRCLLDHYGAPSVYAVATAAVRVASDGPKFVEQANALGFDIEVIDGAREAELATLGVLSYEPQADGLVGDMGGGSLELSCVKNGVLGATSSLPIGALSLMQAAGGDLKNAKPIVDAALDQFDWVEEAQDSTLYIVGGAWRAIARLQMRLRNYPLPILHHFEIPARGALDLCKFVAGQSYTSLQEIEGIPRRRLETLPYAALVLKSVLIRSKVRTVIVSAGGLRDGLIYDNLTVEERQEDPLLAGARFLSSRLSPADTFGAHAAGALQPLFETNNLAKQRIMAAAAALVDVASYFHPDMRGEHIYDTALRAPFYNVSHKDRLSLALALFTRHEGKDAYALDRPELSLVTESRRDWAIRLGLALRLLASFAPKSSALLSSINLSKRDNKIILSVPSDRAALVQDLIIRRLDALAVAFECQRDVEFT
ncbi:MAG: Ppx/GppA family phosphatase [Pseudomonadota bacterium]